MPSELIWTPEFVLANGYEITWARNPELYPYLREVYGYFPGRNGKPNLRYLENDGRHIVGYESACMTGSVPDKYRDRFRRFWQWHPEKDPYWPAPEEAVNPRDVVPGLKTRRPLWGELVPHLGRQ
jgi:hypothetical protein